MPTTIVLRAVKGSKLNHAEMDANFSNLKTTADAALPLAGGTLTGGLIGTTAAFSGKLSGAGTATNDNATAGQIGEYIESTVVSASAAALTTAVAQNVTSISLTAGDWDVSGVVGFKSAATTSITRLIASISATTATIDEINSHYDAMAATVPTAINQTRPVATTRVSVAATTTIYLVASATFTVAALSCFGKISARRVR